MKTKLISILIIILMISITISTSVGLAQTTGPVYAQGGCVYHPNGRDKIPNAPVKVTNNRTKESWEFLTTEEGCYGYGINAAVGDVLIFESSTPTGKWKTNVTSIAEQSMPIVHIQLKRFDLCKIIKKIRFRWLRRWLSRIFGCNL